MKFFENKISFIFKFNFPPKKPSKNTFNKKIPTCHIQICLIRFMVLWIKFYIGSNQ